MVKKINGFGINLGILFVFFWNFICFFGSGGCFPRNFLWPCTRVLIVMLAVLVMVLAVRVVVLLLLLLVVALLLVGL